MLGSRVATTIALVALAGVAHSAPEPGEGWAVGDRYLTLDGEPVYLLGANYITSRWLGSLEDWDAAAIDADLEALRGIGANALRWFPLWPLIQPEPDEADAEKLARIDELVNLVEQRGLFLQISALNGWMSGFTFLPPWADGSIFTDARIVAGEHQLIRAIASRYRDRRAVFSHDFGNELNVLVSLMELEVTPEQVDRWMQDTYRVYKEADPSHPVTNGVGTGFDDRFDIRPISRSSDFLSTHSYPVFNRTHRLDPPLGQRTTYSINYSIAWAAMPGRPVLMQETGQSTAVKLEEDVRAYLRVTAMSAWADEAAGYLWWSSHAIDPHYRVPSEWYFPEYSVSRKKDGDLGPFESELGLLDGENRPRAAGLELAQVAGWLERLGLGWKEQRPVVYVMVPEDHSFERTMIQLITPFTLAKRAHARVRLLYEDRAVPEDAAAVVIAGFGLSSRGHDNVSRYLEAGGVVYQSWEKDFGDGIRFAGDARAPEPVRVWAEAKLGGLSGNQELRLPPMRVRPIRVDEGVEPLALLLTGEQDPLSWSFGEPFFCRTAVGSGRYYYLAGAPEAALERRYDPWPEDQTHHLYEALLPRTDLRLDNPAVELFHKRRGDTEIAVLINHTSRSQTSTLRSSPPRRATDFFDGRVAGAVGAAEITLPAGGVRVVRLLDEEEGD